MISEEVRTRILAESPVHGPIVLAAIGDLAEKAANFEMDLRTVADLYLDACHDHADTMTAFFKMADNFQSALDREAKRLGITT